MNPDNTLSSPTPVPFSPGGATSSVSMGIFRLAIALTASLTLNAVFLVMGVGAMIHHHLQKEQQRRGEMMAERGWTGDCPMMQGRGMGRGYGRPSMAWDRPEMGGWNGTSPRWNRPDLDRNFGPHSHDDETNKSMGFWAAARDLKPEEKAQKLLDRMGDKLNLTEEQKKKIQPLLISQITQTQQSREKTRDQVKAILNPDQIKTLEAMMPSRETSKTEEGTPTK